MSERQIVNRIKKLKDLEEQKTQLEKEMSTLKADIQAQMNDQEELRAGDYIVKWAKITSRKLDTKALKNIFPTICEDYIKVSESRRFSVSNAQ